MKEMASLEARITEISKELHDLTSEVRNHGTEANRKTLLHTLRSSVAQTQTATEVAFQFMFRPHTHAALVSLLRANVIQTLSNNRNPLSAKELSESCSIDELLLIRLMRPLTATGIVDETGVNMYAASDLTRGMLVPGIHGGLDIMFHAAGQALARLPEYLQSTDWKNPSTSGTPIQYAKDRSFWEFINSDPALLSHFNNFMKDQHIHRPEWFELFPVESMLLAGAVTDSDAVFLVDIGGGEGHVLDGFANAFTQCPGRLILQDLPEALDNISKQQKILHARIELQPSDFFQPQPVQGARAYYLRNILHDWDDEDCLRILRNIIPAMKPGYSKIVINEFVLPEKDVPLPAAWMDLNMLAVFASLERTERQWKCLLHDAGLQIVKVHNCGEPGEIEAIIEAVLPE